MIPISRMLSAGLVFLGIFQLPPATNVNFFSLQQDREIGEEARKEVDKSLPVVRSLLLIRTSRRSPSGSHLIVHYNPFHTG